MNCAQCDENIIDDNCGDYICYVCDQVFCSQKCLDKHNDILEEI